MIEVKQLSYTYPGAAQKAVDDVSFLIERGQIFGFLGPNGAGKSTTQNLMTGLLPLQSGQVLYGGKTLAEYGRKFFNDVGVSFEYPNLYDKLTGLENLQYYAALFSVEEVIPAERLLDMVGLSEDKDKRVGQYSKGMKQRLVFARAIQHRPSFCSSTSPRPASTRPWRPRLRRSYWPRGSVVPPSSSPPITCSWPTSSATWSPSSMRVESSPRAPPAT